MKKENDQTPKTHPFYPDHFLIETIVVYLVFGLLLTLAILWPLRLGDKADVLTTPVGIKPPWYFLAAYQAIKYLPVSLGITMVILGCLVLLLWPLLDRSPARHPLRRKASTVFGAVVLLFLILFTLLGGLAERKVSLGGVFYEFDTRAIPHRVGK